MILHTEDERKRARASGKILAHVLDELCAMAAPGIASDAIDARARALIEAAGATPVFLNYTPDGEVRPYPAAICFSVNDMVVHGIPNEHPVILADGDIVSIDSGVVFDGIVTDATRTVIVGTPRADDVRLLAAAEEALAAAIKEAKTGARTGDVSATIERIAKAHGFGVPAELGGHGVGIRMHEDPFVGNRGVRGSGPELREGEMIAIEPIFTLGSPKLDWDEQGGYECRTRDGSRAVQVEHTIIVGPDGGEIVTSV